MVEFTFCWWVLTLLLLVQICNIWEIVISHHIPLIFSTFSGRVATITPAASTYWMRREGDASVAFSCLTNHASNWARLDGYRRWAVSLLSLPVSFDCNAANLTLHVLNYKIDPSFKSIRRVFTEKSGVEVSSKSRSNFKICNILADSKDWKNSYIEESVQMDLKIQNGRPTMIDYAGICYICATLPFL